MPEQESEATMETSFQELPDAPPRRRIRFSLSGKIGIFLVLFWVLMIFIGPSISPYNEADFLDESLFIVPGGDEYPDTDYQPPSKVALLGTDYLGRDTLSRILYGARTTIGISFAATLIAYLLGVTLGIAAVGSTIPILVIMTGFIYATSVFRVARSLGQDVMVSDFVEAAKVRGEGLWWIITREILPNIVMPLATDFGLRFVWIILFISALSFLGLGVQPPMSDWGSMVKENLGGLPYGSIAPLMPSLAIASLTISINLIVDDISAHSGGKLSNKMI